MSAESAQAESEDAGRDDEPVFERKRITLTERHADMLETYANKHYGGNQSQCIRSAISDHARSLDGQNELNVEKVSQGIDELKAEFESLQSSLEEPADGEETDSAFDDDNIEGINDVQALLIERFGTMSPEEIAEELDISRPRAVAAVEQLVEKGQVTRDPEELPEYRIKRS